MAAVNKLSRYMGGTYGTLSLAAIQNIPLIIVNVNFHDVPFRSRDGETRIQNTAFMKCTRLDTGESIVVSTTAQIITEVLSQAKADGAFPAKATFIKGAKCWLIDTSDNAEDEIADDGEAVHADNHVDEVVQPKRPDGNGIPF